MVTLACAVRYIAVARHVTAPGFPLDDAWIHLQFASHLSSGGGMAFNTGEPSTGSTAPLWTVLLSLPMALGVDGITAAIVLGIALAMLAAVVAGEIARLLTGSRAAGVLAGLAVACSPRLTWGALSGMEVPLYTALAGLVLWMFLRSDGRADWRVGLVGGLAALARPELALIVPLLALVSVWARPAAPDRWRAPLTALALCAVVVCADVVLNLALSGRPLPQTFYAKTDGAGLFNALTRGDAAEAWRSVASRPLTTLNLVVRYFAEQSAIFFLCLLPGLLATFGLLGRERPRAHAAVPLMLLISPLALGSLAPVSPVLMQEGRYVAHLLILFFVLAAAGAWELTRLTRHPSVVWALAILAVARLVSQNIGFADQYAAQVANINGMHVEMAHWIERHTPPDASIAANDIGALGYFSKRRIIDLEGLVTPAVLPYRAGQRRVEFLQQVKPQLLVIFPEWYPRVVSRTDLFHEVYRISMPRVSAAHDALVVYDTPWDARSGLLTRSNETGAEHAAGESERGNRPEP
jgi:hypothetical protein